MAQWYDTHERACPWYISFAKCSERSGRKDKVPSSILGRGCFFVSFEQHNVYIFPCLSSGRAMLKERIRKVVFAALLYFPSSITGLAATDCQEVSDENLSVVSPVADDPEPVLFSPFSQAEELASRGFGAGYISLFQELGIDFAETEKPNALAIFPATDHNGAFSSSSLENFVRGLAEHYDVQPFVAAQEQEAYAAFDRYASETDFLILFGHGTPRSLSLGEDDCRLRECHRDETYTIDLSDEEELCASLEGLPSDATIFLSSCSTGYGLRDADNLANRVMAAAPGRIVYAGSAPFQPGGVTVRQWYPFVVTIMGTWAGPVGPWGFYSFTDVTYTNKGSEDE